MTKSFEFTLPQSITSKCLVITNDVIDVIVHNEIPQNKTNTLNIDTNNTTAENYIFNGIDLFIS